MSFALFLLVKLTSGWNPDENLYNLKDALKAWRYSISSYALKTSGKKFMPILTDNTKRIKDKSPIEKYTADTWIWEVLLTFEFVFLRTNVFATRAKELSLNYE